MALAAVILMLFLAGSGAVFWYLQNEAEAATKLALDEQAVRQNLTEAQQAHIKLLEELKEPGGVQRLLNQRSQGLVRGLGERPTSARPSWELQIQTARAAWQRAKDRADNAEGNLDPKLADRLGKMDADLAPGPP